MSREALTLTNREEITKNTHADVNNKRNNKGVFNKGHNVQVQKATNTIKENGL